MNGMTSKLPNNKIIEEFVAFLKGFGVIGLALGVVIGQASQVLVTSLVVHIITPLVGLIPSLDKLSELNIKIQNNGKTVIISEYGNFLTDFINFICLMAVVFLIVKIVVSRMMTDDEKKKIGM